MSGVLLGCYLLDRDSVLKVSLLKYANIKYQTEILACLIHGILSMIFN